MLAADHTAGFSLIELLIAIVLLSVGLLGLAGLQAARLKNSGSTLLRSQRSPWATAFWTRSEPTAPRRKTAIAYPSYRNSVLKGRRPDATIALTKVAQRLERCHTQFGRYSDPGCSVQNSATMESDNGYYRIGVAIDGAGNSYALTATPTAKGAQNEDACTRYRLLSTGERKANNDEISDAAKARETCW